MAKPSCDHRPQSQLLWPLAAMYRAYARPRAASNSRTAAASRAESSGKAGSLPTSVVMRQERAHLRPSAKLCHHADARHVIAAGTRFRRLARRRTSMPEVMHTSAKIDAFERRHASSSSEM